jgi:hypothetical protein
LAHSSLLGGGSLRATAQQHGRNGEVLGRLPEEWRSISIGVGVDIRALIGASVVVARRSTCRRRWCAAVRLVGSQTALASVAVPLAWLLLHWSSVTGLGIHVRFLVEKGQLLVKLVSRLREFVESRTLLGVGAAVPRCWLRFGAAR